MPFPARKGVTVLSAVIKLVRILHISGSTLLAIICLGRLLLLAILFSRSGHSLSLHAFCFASCLLLRARRFWLLPICYPDPPNI